MADKEFLDTKEACKYLGISRTTLSIYVREGKLSQYQQEAPRRVVYRISELDALRTPKLRQ